jgi:hypothetical protein
MSSLTASGGLRKLHGDQEPPQCQGMLNLTDLASVSSDPLAPFTDRLRLAAGADLALLTELCLEFQQFSG